MASRSEGFLSLDKMAETLGKESLGLCEVEAEAEAEGALAGFAFFRAILGRGGFSSSSSSVLESRLR